MANCYFTYSRAEDAKQDEAMDLLFTLLKSKIEDYSSNTVSVTYDRKSFRNGENFRKREEEIAISESVLVFFSPEYKVKIGSEEDHGSKREYRAIKKRAEDGDDSIIPILLAGNVDTAVTAEFKSRICWDLSGINSQISREHGKIRAGKELNNKLNQIAKKAVKEAKAAEYCKTYDFSSIEEEYKRLFLDTAAGPLPLDCVIRTSTHDQIISQSACFVIGRKGSGKTTLLNSIQNDDVHPFLDYYKHLVSIDANAIETDFIFSYLIQRHKNDLSDLRLERILDAFWSIVFFLQGMLIIGVELENYAIDEEDKRITTFRQVANKLKGLLGINRRNSFSESLSKGAICHCAVELLSDHIEYDILKNASSQTPVTAGFNSINAFEVLSKVFGKKLLEKYCHCAKQCTRKFFLALDGFDSHSEDFRKDTNRYIDTNPEEYHFRKIFEIRLYRELLLTVDRIKNNKEICSAEQEYYSSVHFCVIIPQDRFDEIVEDDRDIEKKHFSNLCWDAYDLLQMLVKRLEHHFEKGESPSSESLENKFYRIIRTYMPNIPTEIPITVDEHPYSMPLFNYLLRLSFWRPRDIIMNFAIIMKLSKETEYSREIIPNIIKRYSATGARKIIENEFIGEYRNVYPNLKEVLFSFRDFDLIQDYQSFCQVLSKIEIVASSKAFDTVADKISLLYKLGIIGLYFKKDQLSKFESGYHVCFCFNEGLTPLQVFLSRHDLSSQVRFIFNPIFLKYLSLNINTKELICNYPWTYIQTNHLLKDDIRRI